jgi:class 3 adenylate cyclase/tetratricopeptide (TPR) repeat protein
VNCSACGVLTPPAARFCPSCGHVLQLRADERRVITVLFGDIVGFTALSETLDPERVKILVDEMFDRLAADIVSFGGNVDKVVGDGIVALFGAPVSHGDDAERAVRAALKMQDTVRRFQREVDVPVRMRIGVNTGEALVGSLRADTDYTATGDIVNTASRLQTGADPGTVLVGEETREATLESIRYIEVTPVHAKGKEEPVRAWRAVEALGRPGERRSHLVSPLVGRDDEVALMRSALDMAGHRRRAQLLLIMGDAGIGKTRLAEEIIKVAELDYDAVICTGRCVPYGEANSWQPIAEAVRGALDISPETPLADARANIGAQVAELFRSMVNSPEVERTVGGLLHLLGYDTSVAQLDPQSQVTESGRAVRTFLQGLANRRLVVLWLSDLHWADDAVLRLVDALCNRLSRLPFVVLTTARYALNERWAAQPGRHNMMVVSLDPLDREAATRLIGELLSDDVSSSLRDEIIDRSGGNPFVLQELVALVGNGSRTSLISAELPSSVRGLVSARLDTLTDAERGVLEDASVMGRRGNVKALTRMVATTRADIDLLEVLRSLRDKDLMLLDREEWSFRSDLVRDVAYARLPKTDRARRHAGIAEYMVQHGEGPRVIDAIAFHYRRAAENARELGRVPGLPIDIDDLAIEWLRRAAKGKAADASIRLLGQALALVGDDHLERAPILLERARRAAAQHQLSAARRDVLDARASSLGRADIEAHVSLRLGDVEHRSGDFDHAIKLYTEATAQFRRLGDVAGAAEALRLSGITYLFTSRFEEAESAILAALQAFEDVEDTHGTAWSWQNLAWISFARGRLAQAERRIARAVEFFEHIGDESGVAWCQGLLAYVRLHQGRLDEADTLSATAFIDARERGERWGQGMMLVLRSSVHLWSGRTATALRRAEEALESFRDLGDVFSQSQALAVYARALALVGRVEDAFRVLDDAQRRMGDAPRSENMSLLISTAGTAAAADIGDPEAALVRAGTESIESLDPTIIGQGDRIVAIGLALAQLGRFDHAREVLGRAAREGGDAGRDPNALASLALVVVALGDLDLALELVAAVDASTRSTYVDHALAAIAEAFVHHRRGDVVAATDGLVRARAIVARTEDRVHEMVVASAAAAIDSNGRSEAEERRREIGVDAHGWVLLFRAMSGS